MKKIISICGTRPEAIRVIKDLPNHLIVNTGQHYDENMDAVFWKERGFKPDVNLYAKNFGEIYEKVSELLKKEKPSLVIIYGDTRSSMAGALATKDNDIKLAHLEAGIRCYDMNMPEERNRIMIDSISNYLFVFNEIGKRNLENENVQGKIFIVGDILFDSYIRNRKHDGYIFMTIHRKQNQNLRILKKIFRKYKKKKVIFSVHPGMKRFLKEIPIQNYKNLKIIKPVSYRETLEIIKNAELVVTDSGGVQREACFMGVPFKVMMKKNPLEQETSIFGNGYTEEKIKKIIYDCIK